MTDQINPVEAQQQIHTSFEGGEASGLRPLGREVEFVDPFFEVVTVKLVLAFFQNDCGVPNLTLGSPILAHSSLDRIKSSALITEVDTPSKVTANRTHLDVGSKNAAGAAALHFSVLFKLQIINYNSCCFVC